MRIPIPIADAAVFIGGGAVIIFVVYYGWLFPRSRLILKHWAARSGFQIMHSEFRWFFQGPYFLMSCKGQTVFRVKVRDPQGHERSGWVCCGGIWTGLFSDHAEASWDDEHDNSAA